MDCVLDYCRQEALVEGCKVEALEHSKPGIKPSTSLKETFSVRRIKLTDVVSKSCLGQVWGPFLPKKDQRRLGSLMTASPVCSTAGCCLHPDSFSQAAQSCLVPSPLGAPSLGLLHCSCGRTVLADAAPGPVPCSLIAWGWGTGEVWVWLGSSQHLWTCSRQ